MQRTTKSSATFATVLLLVAGATAIGYQMGIANHAAEVVRAKLHFSFPTPFDFE